MPSGRWYTQRSGQQYGPYTWDELVAEARHERVAASDLVWEEGSTFSRRADSIAGLLPSTPPPVTPSVPPTLPPLVHTATATPGPRRRSWLIPGLGAAMALLVAALVVVLVIGRGGDDGTSTSTDDTEQDTTDATDQDTTVPDSTPTDAVAATVAPDPAALILAADGAIVPGDQILVMLADGKGEDTAKAAAAAVGGEVVGQVELANMWQIRIPATDLAGLDAAVASAGAVDGVDLAIPNSTMTTYEEIWGTPISNLDDPVYNGPQGDGYRMIGVEAAWSYLKGSGLKLNPVHVGITDTGIWKGTGEFSDETLDQPDPTNGVETDPNDVTKKNPDGTTSVTGKNAVGGHGTMVAGIIGANGDNGGQAGIASPIPGLTISTSNIYTPPYGTGFTQVPTNVRDASQVTYPDGVSYTSGLYQAIAKQLASGARVINMSIGCSPMPCHPGTVEANKRYFTKLAQQYPKVLFVAAAGNDNQSAQGGFPGGVKLSNMITVGNINNDGTRNSSSNTSNDAAGFEVTIAAPGHQAVAGVDADGNIVDNTYAQPGGLKFGGGTSMAAPQVAAAAALLLSIDPTLTAEQVKNYIASTGRPSVKRADGTEQDIESGVGDKVLAIDEAVRKLIADKLGKPLSEVTPEWLKNLGTIDAVAVSGDPNQWTVRGIVKACHPACTEVVLELQTEGAVGGDTTQVLGAPGEITWSVTTSKYPATIVVKRSDNGAGSRILIDPIDLNGKWTGGATIASVNVPEGADTQGCDLSALVGMRFGLELELTADPGGGGVAVVTISPPAGTEGETQTQTAELRWNGNAVSMTVTTPDGTFTFDGTAERTADGTGVVIKGSWHAGDGSGISVTGPWDVAKVG